MAAAKKAPLGPLLRFQPFSSLADVGFWERLAALKLDVIKPVAARAHTPQSPVYT